MTLRRGFIAVWPAAVCSGALAGSPAVVDSVPLRDLKACAAIDALLERVACYDRLAGRAVASTVPAAVLAPATTPAASAAAPVPAPAPRPAAVAKQSFGLYTAEHPAPPKPEASLRATVVDVGVSARGRATVTLEGGGLWELDGQDPLLAPGAAVTIDRAAFGSFLMTTPSGRTVRLHRLH